MSTLVAAARLTLWAVSRDVLAIVAAVACIIPYITGIIAPGEGAAVAALAISALFAVYGREGGHRWAVLVAINFLALSLFELALPGIAGRLNAFVHFTAWLAGFWLIGGRDDIDWW